MRPRKHQRDLPACVYHKHGAFWFVKKGRWVRLADNRLDALEAYARLADSPKGEMSELIDAALAAKKNLAPSTRRGYEVAARKLKKMLVEFSPHQVQGKTVAAIKRDLADTPNMANRCLSVLRVVFQYAVEEQIVPSNPCIGIERHEERKRDRYITDAEYVAIWEKAGDRLRVIIDLAYFTGQRIGDVLAIRRADLTDEGIRFRQGKTRTTLTVAWTPPLEDAVARAKALNRSVAAFTLLHNRRGKAPDYRTVRDQWDNAVTAAGVTDAHIHDLRAKALTDAKREGKDATALAGHASAAMTDRYIRLRESPVVQGPSIRQSNRQPKPTT
jgi:integrase